jgi:hypothetical protein
LLWAFQKFGLALVISWKSVSHCMLDNLVVHWSWLQDLQFPLVYIPLDLLLPPLLWLWCELDVAHSYRRMVCWIFGILKDISGQMFSFRMVVCSTVGMTGCIEMEGVANYTGMKVWRVVPS